MDAAIEEAFALNTHAVQPARDLGDASWPKLALQLAWVVLAQALATLVCSARARARRAAGRAARARVPAAWR
jgi:hypothetical protein